MTERLDRIEAVLDRMAERQDRMQEGLSQTNATIDRLTERQDRMQQEMYANFEYLGSETGKLIRSVVDLRQQMAEYAQRAEQDRSQAAIDRAEFRSTVDRILQVLTERFTHNGDG